MIAKLDPSNQRVGRANRALLLCSFFFPCCISVFPNTILVQDSKRKAFRVSMGMYAPMWFRPFSLNDLDGGVFPSSCLMDDSSACPNRKNLPDRDA